MIIPVFFGKIEATEYECGSGVSPPSRVASRRLPTMRYKSIPELTPEQEDRFWSNVDVPAQPSCCWEWIGERNHKGYGRVSINASRFVVHRVAYSLLIEPVPEDMQIDHLCRTRYCVNPDHLQPVTNRENLVRGYGVIARSVRATHCPQGHAYTPENTRLYRRARVCRTCDIQKKREARRR